MSVKKLIIRGIYFNYIHKAAAGLFIFLITPIMLKNIGQSAYGVWAILYAVFGYFMMLDIGFNTAIAKYTAEHLALDKKETLNRIVSSVFMVLLGIGFLIVLICIGVAPLFVKYFKIPADLHHETKIAFLIMGINTAFVLISGLYANIIYGLQRVDIWQKYCTIQIATNALLIMFLLHMGTGLIGISISYVLSTLLVFILYIYFLRVNNYGIVVKPSFFDLKTLKEISPYSVRTFILASCGRILYYTDYIVIGFFLGAASVAPYEITYKLCFYATFIFSPISTSVFPQFSSLYSTGNYEALGRLYLRIAKLSLAIMMPVGIFLILFGSSFIKLWVGGENFAGSNVLMVLVLMAFMHALGTPSGLLLQGIGKNVGLIYMIILDAILNLTLSVILIQKMGILGVALGTLIAHLATTFWICPLLVCKHIKVSIKQYIIKGVVPPVVAGVVTYWIIILFVQRLFLQPTNYYNLIMNGALSTAIFVVIYLFATCNSEERAFYFGLFRKLKKA